MPRFLLILVLGLSFLSPSALGQAPCSKLETVLSYPQHSAPTSVSGVLLLVLENVNSLGLHSVESVSITWAGEDFLSGKTVGLHWVKTEVVRVGEEGLEGGGGCFEVGFKITDTDECAREYGRRGKGNGGWKEGSHCH